MYRDKAAGKLRARGYHVSLLDSMTDEEISQLASADGRVEYARVMGAFEKRIADGKATVEVDYERESKTSPSSSGYGAGQASEDE